MSFAPPPSRWDFQFHHEALSFGSHDDVQFYGSSTSSNNRESGRWVRRSNVANNQYLVSNVTDPYFSSPSDSSPVQQWTPPAIQEIRADVYDASRGDVLKSSSFSPTMEGNSAVMDSRSSTSSWSDSGCDYEALVKSHSSYRNFSGRGGCFMSKAVHHFSFPLEMSTREASGITSSELSEYDNTLRRDRLHLSSATASIDLTGLSEHVDDDLFNRCHGPSDRIRCGLCEKFLSQRSPWSCRRIVRSDDMPVASILSCRHVFHAECLEQTTPKAHKSDPPCPICVKVEDENSRDPQIISKLHIPTRNTVLSLNRTRFRKSLSVKGIPGKLRASGS